MLPTIHVPAIRKRMLRALDEHIIPVLKSKIVTQVLAGPPYDFSHVRHWTEQKAHLRELESNSLEVREWWPDSNLVRRRMSQLDFFYHGATYHKVGVTRAMARELRKNARLPVPPGITTFELIAPSAVHVPLRAPHVCIGHDCQEYGEISFLGLQYAGKELLLRCSSANDGGTHHVSYVDADFREQERAYVEALEQRQFAAAQQLLLAIMEDVRSNLIRNHISLSNSAWPSFGNRPVLAASYVSPRNAKLCYQAIDFIQFHLHGELTLELLARECGVSREHLSRVFRLCVGIPLMQYVTERRLRAAEMMLVRGRERVVDIARLTGFSSSQSFTHVFRRHNKMSPTQYRRNARFHEA